MLCGGIQKGYFIAEEARNREVDGGVDGDVVLIVRERGV